MGGDQCLLFTGLKIPGDRSIPIKSLTTQPMLTLLIIACGWIAAGLLLIPLWHAFIPLGNHPRQ